MVFCCFAVPRQTTLHYVARCKLNDKRAILRAISQLFGGLKGTG